MRAKFFHRDHRRLCSSLNFEVAIALEPAPLAEKDTMPDEVDAAESYSLIGFAHA